MNGNLALDLAGTVGSRRDKPVDVLAAPADLERWVAECDELPGCVAADFAAFESALSLREATYQLAVDRLLDGPSIPAASRSSTTRPSGKCAR